MKATRRKAGDRKAVVMHVGLVLGALTVLAVSAGATEVGSWSMTQNLPPGFAPAAVADCVNLTAAWASYGSYITYSCAEGGPAFTVNSQGNYTATVEDLNFSNASSLWIYYVQSTAIVGPVPVDCANLTGAVMLVNNTTGNSSAPVPLGANSLLGTGYNYCVDPMPGAVYVGPFTVTWTAPSLPHLVH